MRGDNELVFHRANGPLLNPGMIFTLLFVGVLFFVRAGKEESFTFVLISVIIALALILVIPVLANYSLAALLVDKNNSTVTLVKNKWIWMNKEEQFNFSGIKITFKEEVRVKGMKRRIFRFFYENKLIVEVYPPTSGWQTEELEKAMSIIAELQEKLIEQHK